MIERISHVMMWGNDLGKIAQWYKDKLGFQVSYLAPGEFLSLYHETMGRLDFHGAGGDKSQIGKGPLPYYRVSDIEKTKSWLEAKGIKVDEIQQVTDSPKHTWFWDCEGNKFGIEGD